jgi:hypothetical protein
MKLGTHMPDGERRKPIDIEVCRTKVKVTTSKKCVYQVSFRSGISFLRYCVETIAPPGRHSSYYKPSSTSSQLG